MRVAKIETGASSKVVEESRVMFLPTVCFPRKWLPPPQLPLRNTYFMPAPTQNALRRPSSNARLPIANSKSRPTRVFACSRPRLRCSCSPPTRLVLVVPAVPRYCPRAAVCDVLVYATQRSLSLRTTLALTVRSTPCSPSSSKHPAPRALCLCPHTTSTLCLLLLAPLAAVPLATTTSSRLQALFFRLSHGNYSQLHSPRTLAMAARHLPRTCAREICPDECVSCIRGN
ncbi:hypothetical protein PYCCODRAFT_1305915 [Trametes coccinea BRFM310]|uniref:Uncharacterized protein n=1 Tax=Trametes coccinea (strain BRFM310) TaxID=1353009 RepID=A0A1Y2I5S9_TRAC3|nr:hypothetical protein PYCCODRAFT_1305915 [Trametes coccinea BRFM310]